MNFFKAAYFLGCILFFAGMLWIFLPHTSHNLITQEDGTEHYIHLVQGALSAASGAILLILSEKIKKKAKRL